MNAPNNQNAVKVRNLRKSFGSIEAVQGMNLELRSGEMYGLIGPDGAGKTTVLRILCGLLVADDGEVRLLGFDPVRQPERIRDVIGYMPQKFSLYPDLTVAENMRFFTDIYHVSKAERLRITERLVQFSRLGPFADRKAGALSGGMKQKLALSCTLIHTPKLLILDEPTTGVDPVSRGEFWDILRDLRQEGVTILVTTPYMDEASLCDRISLMFEGYILAEGTPDQIIAEFPEHIIRVYTGRPQEVAEILKQKGDFRSVHVFGDRVHVAVKDVKKSKQLIEQLLEKSSADYGSIAEAKPDLEDVFVNRVGQVT